MFFFPGESEFITSAMSDECSIPDIQTYHEFLQYDRIFLGRKLKIDKNLNFTELVHSFLTQKNTENKKIYGSTIHIKFACLAKIWPTAKFIYIVRDPRDVASSCVKFGWAGNTWFGVNGWLRAEEYLTRLKTMISPEKLLEVRYEDLIRNPTEILAIICDFLGIDYSEDMFNYVKNSPYNRPDARYLCQWKRKLSPKDIQLVEYRARDLMIAKQYEHSDYPSLSPTPFSLTWLTIDDFWKRLIARINRYGVSTVLQDMIGRRLNIQSMRKKAKLKMNLVNIERLDEGTERKMTAKRLNQSTEPRR